MNKDYHCAWKMVMDVNGKSLKEAYGLVAANNTGHGDYYFRSNCLNRLCGVGASYKFNGGKAAHTTEVQWDFKNASKGIMGHPLFWRMGGHYHLQNGHKAHWNMLWGDKLSADMKFEVPISS